jgi:EAL domain-containing protein (putative c-di-GMP-specific phosphodiesterase class I)
MARILAVDDEPLVRRAVARVMTRLGHDVAEAPDGTSALTLVRETAFDVAFVDYDMPGGVDGLAVLSHLRVAAPRCARVLMTGRPDFPVVQAINEGEILRILPKPFNAAQLEGLLGDCLDAARRQAMVDAHDQEAARAAHMFRSCMDGGLQLALQPIVPARGAARAVAVEALLRPRSGPCGDVTALLGAAERCDQIPELGAAVNALAAAWAARLPPDLLLFVNVHPGQLDAPGVLGSFGPLLPHARRVVLEITERASLLEIERWESTISQLETYGFRFALDDLGSGYGGLSLLAQLRPAFIKIDMSIVRNVHEKPHKRRVVDVMADFADATGARLIAEGVESRAEAEALVQSGAHLLQGHLFGHARLDWPPTPGDPG